MMTSHQDGGDTWPTWATPWAVARGRAERGEEGHPGDVGGSAVGGSVAARTGHGTHDREHNRHAPTDNPPCRRVQLGVQVQWWWWWWWGAMPTSRPPLCLLPCRRRLWRLMRVPHGGWVGLGTDLPQQAGVSRARRVPHSPGVCLSTICPLPSANCPTPIPPTRAAPPPPRLRQQPPHRHATREHAERSRSGALRASQRGGDAGAPVPLPPTQLQTTTVLPVSHAA